MDSRAGQRHQIMRQVLEVGGCSGDAQQAVSLLRAIYYRRLLPIIETTCSALSPPGQVHRVDLLEIDLGAQPLDGFERSIADAFEPAFARALAAALATTEPEAPDAELALITYFIHTGMVPWWADRSDARLLDASLEALIARAPDALCDAIVRATADAAVWRRIVRAFPDRLLDALTALLMPAGAVVDHGAGPRWVALLTAVVRDSGRSPAAVRQIWWEEVLKAARTVSTSVAGAPQWFAGIFSRVAQRLALDDGEFVAGLHAAIGRVNAALPGDEAPSPQMRLVADVLWQDARDRGAIAELKRSTVAGKTVARTQEPSPPSEEDERVEAEAAARTPRAMSDGREAEPSTSAARRRAQAALRFSDADETYVDNAGTGRAVAVSRAVLHARSASSPMSAGSWTRTRDSVPSACCSTWRPPRPQRRSSSSPSTRCCAGCRSTRCSTSARRWPGRRSKPATRSSPRRSSTRPILRDMSIAGFRSSFLLRDGQLSTRDGNWLLRVQRETHDIVLDRFPWSARVVKLPWMDAMVVVEW